MHYLPQIIFIIVSIAAISFFAKKAMEIRRNILLGRDEEVKGNPATRWKNVLLLAFGQKKMFRNPLVAVMHFICICRVYHYQY